jgi:hypothetical protein
MGPPRRFWLARRTVYSYDCRIVYFLVCWLYRFLMKDLTYDQSIEIRRDADSGNIRCFHRSHAAHPEVSRDNIF